VLVVDAMADEIPGSAQRFLRIGFGSIDLLSAFIVYLAVFQGLPSRYLPIDLAAGLVIALLLAGGIGLFLQRRWAFDVARLGSWITLVLGLALVSTLAVTASYLAGIYGPVGRGGAIIMTLAAALGLPYLVVLPVTQLVWLGPFRFRAATKVEVSGAGSP
jgi:hypothetical protein